MDGKLKEYVEMGAGFTAGVFLIVGLGLLGAGVLVIGAAEVIGFLSTDSPQMVVGSALFSADVTSSGLHVLYPPFTTERAPILAGQVTSPSEIKVGEKYLLVNQYPSQHSREVEVTDLPYLRQDGGWVAMVEDSARDRETIFLSDFGVVPYEVGTWNPLNRMMKTGKKDSLISSSNYDMGGSDCAIRTIVNGSAIMVDCSQITMNVTPTLYVFRLKAPDNWIANYSKQVPSSRIGFIELNRNPQWIETKIIGTFGRWNTSGIESGVNFLFFHNEELNTTYVFVNDSIGWIYMQDRNGQWWKLN